MKTCTGKKSGAKRIDLNGTTPAPPSAQKLLLTLDRRHRQQTNQNNRSDQSVPDRLRSYNSSIKCQDDGKGCAFGLPDSASGSNCVITSKGFELLPLFRPWKSNGRNAPATCLKACAFLTMKNLMELSRWRSSRSLFFFLLWLSGRVGVLLHQKIEHFFRMTKHGDLGLVVSATLTLLGLLIGFSFSMAISRYDLRKSYERGRGKCDRHGIPPRRFASRRRCRESAAALNEVYRSAGAVLRYDAAVPS